MLVCRLEEPSHFRLHTQQLEVVAGDCIAGDTPCRMAPAQSRLRVSIEGGHVAEGAVALPKVYKRRIGRSHQLEARPRLGAKLVEILRMAHIQRAQQDCIQYSKNDNVGPDPKHQSDNSHERERR